MSNTIKITKEIPAPPEGFRHEDRIPNVGEEAIAFDMGMWTPPAKAESWGWARAGCNLTFAFRIPKKKRLMTPQEVADGWLQNAQGVRFRVASFCKNWVKLVGVTTIDHIEMPELIREGWSFCSSANSESRSLEVDDER